MLRLNTRFAFSLVFPVLLITGGCGSGSRQLQTVALSPSSADAQNFPNGQVTFTATGIFSQPPSPLKLTGSDVSWCVGNSNGLCAGNIAVGALIDQTGVAICNGPFTGTVTILAGKADSPVMPDTGTQLTVFGSAKLTCP
jgi:hypothetical protein